MDWTVESLIMVLYVMIFATFLVLYLWIRSLSSSLVRVHTQLRDIRLFCRTLSYAILELQDKAKPPQVTSLKNMPKISIMKDEG